MTVAVFVVLFVFVVVFVEIKWTGTNPLAPLAKGTP